MKTLPNHLLSILQLKMKGYTHQSIADNLGYPVATVKKYTQRLIAAFKAEGMWDSRIDPAVELMNCGQRYFEALAAAAAFIDLDGTIISFAGADDIVTPTDAKHIHIGANFSQGQIAQILQENSYAPYEAVTRALYLAEHLYRDWLFTEAIQVLHVAENFRGAGVNQAAFAACNTAQMYVELGDFRSAQEKIIQARYTYEAIADLDVQLRMQHIHGWLAYYQGHLDQAEDWYRNSLAKVTSHELEYLTQDAHHFLGRIYGSRGQLCTQQQHAAEWFHKAESHLDKAYQLHLVWGDDDSKGYDLLRMAQLRRAQRRWRDARQLREQARNLFGTGLFYLDIDLEEAGISLKNKDDKDALRKAEAVLEGLADGKRTKGVADALRAIGDAKCLQGKVQQSLELYLASLCVYPYENYPSNRRLWSEISTILRQEDRPNAQKQIQNIRVLIEERKGSFAYLNTIPVDRSSDIINIVNELETLVP